MGARLNMRGTVFLYVRISLSGCMGITFCAFLVRGHSHDRSGGGGCRSCSQYAACGGINAGIEFCLRKAVDGSFGLSHHRAVISVEQGLEIGLVRTAVLLRSGSRHFFQAEEAGFVQAAPYGFGDFSNIGARDVFQSLVINGQGDDAVSDGGAVRPLDLNADVALFTGPVLGFARRDGRFQNLPGWRNQQFGSSPFLTVKALTPILGMSSRVRRHSTRAVCRSRGTRLRDSFFQEFRRKVQTRASG